MKSIVKKLLWTEILSLIVLGFFLYPQSYRYMDFLRGISAFLYILYVPGYRVSYLFFKKSEVSTFERFMMSFALSLMIASFSIFYLHYFHIPVYHIYTYFIVSIIVFIVFIVLSLQTRKKNSIE